MSFIRSPIYVWYNCHGDVSCCENGDIKTSLHTEMWNHNLKPGENADEIAYRHMAEHYQKLNQTPQGMDEADLVYFHAVQHYLEHIPILGYFIRRLVWHFTEKYGFGDD